MQMKIVLLTMKRKGEYINTSTGWVIWCIATVEKLNQVSIWEG